MQVTALGYVGIEARSPQDWAQFGAEILGLPLGGPADGGVVRLRMDERCYRLAVHPGQQDGLAYLGWEVPNARALQEAFAELEAAGVEPRPGRRTSAATVGCAGWYGVRTRSVIHWSSSMDRRS